MPLSCAFPSRRRCALRCALVSDGRPRVGARRAQGCGEWLTAAVQGAVIDERSEVSSLRLWTLEMAGQGSEAAKRLLVP